MSCDGLADALDQDVGIAARGHALARRAHLQNQLVERLSEQAGARILSEHVARVLDVGTGTGRVLYEGRTGGLATGLKYDTRTGGDLERTLGEEKTFRAESMLRLDPDPQPVVAHERVGRAAHHDSVRCEAIQLVVLDDRAERIALG